MLGLRQAYSTATKALNFGVQGYHVQNKYFDPKNQSFGLKKSVKKLQTKKGSYLDDYVAIHGKIPGPGVYNYSEKGSVYQKVRQKKINYPDKKTIFDEMCEKQKKQKNPAPGQYQLAQKKRPVSAFNRKPKVQDRTTFLDEVQYQSSVTPGVGSYNPRPQSAKVERRDRMKPEDWISKHKKQDKTSGKTKQPTPFSYDPMLMGKKSFLRTKKGCSTFGNIDRFKIPSNKDSTGPGKYVGHQQWNAKTKTCSNFNSPSVYYR